MLLISLQTLIENCINNNSMNTVMLNIKMISPNIVDNTDSNINNTNTDSINVRVIVYGNEDIRISNININVISNIHIIINSNKVVVNNAINITNSISSNSIMDLTTDKTVNSTNDNHNIIYIDMVNHHVNDIFCQ